MKRDLGKLNWKMVLSIAGIILLLFFIYRWIHPEGAQHPPITYSTYSGKMDAETLIKNGVTYQQCLEAIAEKIKDDQTVGTEGGQRIFLRTCLNGAKGDKADFCKSVPSPKVAGAALRWREAQCKAFQLNQNSTCIRHLQEVLDFCIQ